MFSAVIVEDEQDSLDALKFAIETFCPEVEVIGEAKFIDEAVELIKDTNPSILFLDIQIHNSLGFEVLDRLEHNTALVIFTTSFESYSIQALRAEAIDFLLKPIDPEDLIAAVDRCKRKIHQSKDQKKKDSENKNAITKIGVPTSEGIEIVSLSEVLRFEASNNYTYIFYLNNKKMIVSRTLKAFENILPNNQFVRVHQSHLVNVNYIKSYKKNNTGFLLLHKDVVVPIGKSYRALVKELINNLYPTI